MSDPNEQLEHSEMLSYYESFGEEQRLARGAELLEFARMQELIRRFIPSPPRVVIYVGGGPGRYSCWLARSGYEVHLLDPVQKHIEQALEASASQPDYPLASATQGDARSLSYEDDSADVVLLMGPLYHLSVRAHGLAALREAYRVLKPGGLLLAEAINRFTSLVDGLTEGFIDDPTFIPILRRDLEEGQHRGDPDNMSYFTTAFFHRPEEPEAEVREAGFKQKGLYSVEGPGEFAANLDERMSDPTKRAQLLELVRSVEHERTLLGVSSHFVVVATRECPNDVLVA